MNSSGHGGRRSNQRGRPPKWGKRMQWNILLPIDLARRADIFRRGAGVSQSELVEQLLLDILEGTSDGMETDKTR